jgi:hypothetical protein
MRRPIQAAHDRHDPIPKVEHQLTAEFKGRVPDEVIREVARSSVDEFRDARVKDFVPILAARRARSRLQSNHW